MRLIASYSLFLIIVFVFRVEAEELVPKPESRIKISVKEIKNEASAAPISPEWKAWLNTYASSTPLMAERKANIEGYRPTDEQIKEVLGGNAQIKFPFSLELGSKDLTTYNLTQSTTALRFETMNQFDLQLLEPEMSKARLSKEVDRFRVMRSHMQTLIKNRKPNEIVLLVVGATHGHDLFYSFFLDPDRKPKDPLYRIHTDVYYAQPPADPSSMFYTNDYYVLQKSMRGTEIEKSSLKNFGVLIYTEALARLYYYRGLSSKIVSLDDLLKERENKLGAIVFLDRHRLQSPKIYADLPDAGSLISMGINEVVFGVEGMEFGRDYSLDDLKPFYLFDDKSYFATEEDRQYYKKFRPEAFKILKKGIVYDANWKVLTDKLRSYQGRGVRVRVTGVEDHDRISPTVSEGSTRSQN